MNNNFYESVAFHLDEKKGLGDSWGFEFIGDYAFCSEEIDDENNIRNFFAELVKELKMITMSDLWIKQFPEKGYPNPAVSAFQGITTSSIIFHGDNKHGAFFLNVFSCKSFDKTIVTPLVKKHFNPASWQERFLLRRVGRIENN